jgi:hypothetical protein
MIQNYSRTCANQQLMIIIITTKFNYAIYTFFIYLNRSVSSVMTINLINQIYNIKRYRQTSNHSRTLMGIKETQDIKEEEI